MIFGKKHKFFEFVLSVDNALSYVVLLPERSFEDFSCQKINVVMPYFVGAVMRFDVRK